jgi:glycosyltransferase involved in cell wall biosynthesis
MRVLVTVPSQQLLGGVTIFYRELRKYLPAEVEYFEVGARGPETGRAYFLLRLFNDYRRFAAKLREGRYDLVHINPSLTCKAVIRDSMLLVIAKMHGQKVLVYFHGWDKHCEALITRYFRAVFRLVYCRASAVIVLAQEFAERIRKLGFDNPIYVETTVAGDWIFERGCALSGSDHMNKDLCQILFMSRLEPGKGVREALEVFRLLKIPYPRIVLTVAGDGSELEGTRQYVRQTSLGGVSLPGRVDGSEKSALFINSDIFLFPTSYGEGMPLSVLEAMAAGLPVVTCRVGGIRDFFIDGVMGYSTEHASVTELAAHVEKLIVDTALRQHIGAHNRAYARERFAASRVAARLFDIYRTTISDERPN